MLLAPAFKRNERDYAYLRDMLDAAREAMSFVRGLDPGVLETDRKLALALVQELAIIGEAAGRISHEAARSAPGIPWPKVVGMRNQLIPGDREVDLEVEGRYGRPPITGRGVGTALRSP